MKRRFIVIILVLQTLIGCMLTVLNYQSLERLEAAKHSNYLLHVTISEHLQLLNMYGQLLTRIDEYTNDGTPVVFPNQTGKPLEQRPYLPPYTSPGGNQ